MKIAIDISQIVYGTGVSVYTKNLVENLLKIDKDNDYMLFAGSLRRSHDIKKIFPQTKIFPIPPTAASLLWNKLHIIPIEKLIGDIDVLHTSDWTEPASKAFKVTTVHDLAPFLYPNLFPKDILRNIVDIHTAKLSRVKEESDRIIVPTMATKEDLINLGFPSYKIRVIPEAASTNFTRSRDEQILALKRKYQIHDKYLISVGMDPRKNTTRLIKAFEQATAGHDVKLIFIGQPKYLNINPSRNIRILGNVESDDLPVLYSGAEALVYPSLYEGFGLPILEAMACGTPVITSNISSMKEVAGNAAILVDPYSVDEIESAIKKVIRGAREYSLKGSKRVKEFSWENTAKMTQLVYLEAKNKT